MLGGAFAVLQPPPNMTICPLYNFLALAYRNLLGGAGMDTLWDSVLVMTPLGAAAFSLGTLRFRKQFQ